MSRGDAEAERMTATMSEGEELALRAIVRGEATVGAEIPPWRRSALRAAKVLQSPEDLRRLAGHLAQLGRLDDAEIVAQFMIVHHRSEFLCLEVAGDIAFQSDDILQALHRYQRAVAMEGRPRVARLGVARVLSKMGAASEAVGFWRDALDLYNRCATLLTMQPADRGEPWEWYEPWRGPAPLALLADLRGRCARLEERIAQLTPAVFGVRLPEDQLLALQLGSPAVEHSADEATPLTAPASEVIDALGRRAGEDEDRLARIVRNLGGRV